jgi:hypothetical protein
MKMKRSKAISVFFLVSFFISFTTNIAIASIVSPIKTLQTQTKDHLHLNETVVSSAINDILFEENENEDENELDLDLSLVLIPFFLETISILSVVDAVVPPSTVESSIEQPIYIQISNIRI